jgi:hypothetical protein
MIIKFIFWKMQNMGAEVTEVGAIVDAMTTSHTTEAASGEIYDRSISPSRTSKFLKPASCALLQQLYVHIDLQQLERINIFRTWWSLSFTSFLICKGPTVSYFNH